MAAVSSVKLRKTMIRRVRYFSFTGPVDDRQKVITQLEDIKKPAFCSQCLCLTAFIEMESKSAMLRNLQSFWVFWSIPGMATSA